MQEKNNLQKLNKKIEIVKNDKKKINQIKRPIIIL